MKKALLYLLLFTYSVNLVKPVLPYVKDTISHIFWYAEHMATVHYENGTCHVHYEALAAAKKNDPEKSSPVPKTGKEVSEHEMLVTKYEFSSSSLLKPPFSNSSADLPQNRVNNLYPPPKMS